jgi:glyoxylase-like metal-dependent hydrolase (beta-lactamase superfamily II)/ferredoxin
MADPKKRLAGNVAGEFFVDATCIDCDTCRQLAPATFRETGEYSTVYCQPDRADLRRAALQALLACPTGSIGTTGRNEARTVQADFPLVVEPPVYYCGFNSSKSFGGNSYFLRHPEGNWLIDSPRFLPALVRRFSEWGGVAHIFLTHRDDVADADKYAARFGSRRIIHFAELAAQPDAELVLRGTDPIPLGSDVLAIPTPGHTAGHCVLLYADRFLFTGDHLWWNREHARLGASRTYCWGSWTEQTASMNRLRGHSFEWILPGHGQRVHLRHNEMRRQLGQLVERMQSNSVVSTTE